jgi:hypothetical protein
MTLVAFLKRTTGVSPVPLVICTAGSRITRGTPGLSRVSSAFQRCGKAITNVDLSFRATPRLAEAESRNPLR